MLTAPPKATAHNKRGWFRKALDANRYGLLLVIGLLLLAMAGTVQAQDPKPAAVELRFFRGTAQTDRVWLEWETATEQDVAAFMVARGPAEEGPFEAIVQVDAVGSPTLGAYYDVYDEEVEQNQTYWYQLVEVLFDNSQNPLMVTEVFVEPPGGIIPPGGGNGAETPIPTSTDPATATPPATSTPTPSKTPTPGPTQPAVQPTETPAPVTPTWTPRPPGPTPTAFRFPTDGPPPPATPDVGITIVEAAELPAQGYPGAATATPQVVPDFPSELNGVNTVQPSPYPQDSASPTAVPATPVNGQLDGTAQSEEPAESSARSRLFLWLGFAGGLLILGGGIFFSVALATRQR